MSKVPKIKDFIPCGNWVFVELLNEDEILGTELTIVASGSPDAKGLDGAPQAYVKALGAKVDEQWGFGVGDRVLFSTAQFIPCPNVKLEDDEELALDTSNKPKRARGLISPQHIVAVAKE
tara:strand:- start:2704 stop:3063 length:360 start_codon:yes stop_codon:yes gene_type:complete